MSDKSHARKYGGRDRLHLPSPQVDTHGGRARLPQPVAPPPPPGTPTNTSTRRIAHKGTETTRTAPAVAARPAAPTEPIQPATDRLEEILEKLREGSLTKDEMKKALRQAVSFLAVTKEPPSVVIPKIVSVAVVRSLKDGSHDLLEDLLSPKCALGALSRKYITDKITADEKSIILTVMADPRVREDPMKYDQIVAGVLDIVLCISPSEGWNMDPRLEPDTRPIPWRIYMNSATSGSEMAKPLKYALVRSCLPSTASVLVKHGGKFRNPGEPNLERCLFVPANSQWASLGFDVYCAFWLACWDGSVNAIRSASVNNIGYGAGPILTEQQAAIPILRHWITLLEDVIAEWLGSFKNSDKRIRGSVKDIDGNYRLISKSLLDHAVSFLEIRQYDLRDCQEAILKLRELRLSLARREDSSQR